MSYNNYNYNRQSTALSRRTSVPPSSSSSYYPSRSRYSSSPYYNDRYSQNNYSAINSPYGYGDDGYGGGYGYNQPLYFEDRMFNDEMDQIGELSRTPTRPTWRKSKMLANPDFGNFQFRKGYSAEVWLNSGETVVLSGHSRKKQYRTHYSPEYLKSFFFGWIGRLLRYFYLDRLFGLHIDTVKTMITKNYIFVTAHIL